MADITMCNNTLCPLAGNCYRVQATPNHMWQSFTMFEYKLSFIGAVCDHYIPVHQVTVENSAVLRRKPIQTL